MGLLYRTGLARRDPRAQAGEPLPLDPRARARAALGPALPRRTAARHLDYLAAAELGGRALREHSTRSPVPFLARLARAQLGPAAVPGKPALAARRRRRPLGRRSPPVRR